MSDNEERQRKRQLQKEYMYNKQVLVVTYEAHRAFADWCMENDLVMCRTLSKLLVDYVAYKRYKGVDKDEYFNPDVDHTYPDTDVI